jgi:hypothetical protein
LTRFQEAPPMDPTLYRLTLFAHVLGMTGFFMALGAYVFGLVALRQARRVEQVRAICRVIFLTDPVAVVGILLLAAAGLTMALTEKGFSPPQATGFQPVR